MSRYAKHWTPAEDTTLRVLWAKGTSVQDIARQLPGRTPVAVYQRAHKAGLTSRPPLGWELVDSSARRTGLNWATLKRVLKTAKIRVYRAQVAPWLKRRRHAKLIVRRSEVDRALKAHLQKQSVPSAARSHNVRADYLRHRLALLGLKAPKRRSKLLVTDEQVAEALAIPTGQGQALFLAKREIERLKAELSELRERKVA